MTFLITGAGRGIGLEFANQLLHKNHSVIAWVRSPEKSTELAQLKEKFSQTLTIQKVDLLKPTTIEHAVQSITHLDTLINNAGVLLDSDDSLNSISIEKIENTFKINLSAPLFVTQQLLPVLQKSRSPLIINITSRMGSIADNTSGGYYAYRMSKTALNMFTKSLSIDFPKIKTFCMHPGWVQTEMGGSGATTTTEQSVSGLLSTILEPSRFESGSFVSFQGQIIPW